MKLFIISNRLPISFEEKDGKYTYKKSSGGLVSGISSYLSSINTSEIDKTHYHWIGWPGTYVPKPKQEDIKLQLSKDHLIPLFIRNSVMDNFYLGFCNKTLWPLFHYFPVYTFYKSELWENYKYVNELFCEQIIQYINEDDIIWIHDYHLMLLPELIRKKFRNAKIGFFLHIPFPHYEIYRLLPPVWREDILKGLLGADLIGFHTNDYSRYFLGSVLRILGYKDTLNEIIYDERSVTVKTFPMGIDFKTFEKNSKSIEVLNESINLKSTFSGQKIILSIDRLDYSKGILNRLNGFQTFLKNNPEWHEKVTLLVVMVPSRIGVDRYKSMKKEVDETIGKINGLYSTLTWTPIIYQYRSFDNIQLIALYKISDVALITPLRDGMNLIAKEYLASRTDNTGVLVLSEMTGASKEMIETMSINPNNNDSLADAIKDALEMDIEEQKNRNSAIRKRLEKNNVISWAANFLNELDKSVNKNQAVKKRYLDDKIKKQLLYSFLNSKNRILFLDYDGTLMNFFDDPKNAKPDSDLINIITQLSYIPDTDIVLISGRNYETMEEWFGNININFVAEHGIWIKQKDNYWKKYTKIDSSWKAKLIPYLQEYTNLLTGSFYEEKSHSLVWHFRKSDKLYAEVITNEFVDMLTNVVANMNLQVQRGNNIIDIRAIDINKGTAVKTFLNFKEYNFTLAAGDDYTDEDMFKVLPDSAYTIKIGVNKSNAKYFMKNTIEFRNLLKEIINAK